jgi:quinol monooxygenase YgiN
VAALDEHNEAPHVRNAFARAPSLLAAAPEIERCKAIG